MPLFLARILDLRRHPFPGVRLAWWVGLGALFWLAAVPGPAGNMLFGAWLALNLVLVFTALGWAVFHPRAILGALRPAAAGSFWVALVATVWIGSIVAVQFSERIPESMTPALRTGMVLGSPVLLVGLLCGAFGVALVWAALGAYTARRQPFPEAASTGVSAGWTVLTAGLLTALLGGVLPLPPLVTQGFVASAPLMVVLLTQKAMRTGCTPTDVHKQGIDWLARRLILRWQAGEKPRRLDLRGPALGLAAAGVGALLAFSLALLPLQAQALVAFLQVRNSFELSLPDHSRRPPVSEAVRATLLQLDLETRRRAATTGSEASVQAETIRKLSRYGARIVLPLPLLEPLQEGEINVAVQTRGRVSALPTEADIRRSRADLDELTAAVRASGAVFLGLSTRQAITPHTESAAAAERLAAVAAGVGRTDTEAFGAPELPVITTLAPAAEGPPGLRDRGWMLTPLPLVLAAGSRGREAVQGMPQIAPDKVLVAVHATQPEQSFPRLDYGTVLRGEPVLVPAAEANDPAGRWVRPEEYFRGRTVFLDTLVPATRDTVAGRMSQAEVLAHALATLQSRSTTGRVPGWVSLLVLVAAGLITGAACTGCSPLRAAWIAFGLELGVLFSGIVLFLAPVAVGLVTDRGPATFGSVWLDPVPPMVVVLAAYLLAANLTLAVERAQRERNKGLLQRFVAPQVVNELLDEMEDFGGDVVLGGKRQQVCVIFADVRGFTRFAEAQPPEVVIEVTNQYLTALTEALHRHGGLLDKYLGDGLMALFRVTDPEVDVRKAVHAALAMRDAAATVSMWQAAQGHPVLQVGISLHYGEAVVGLVGNPAQFNYTALGHTVVVTQRLQSVAGAGEVILSETVYALVEGEVFAETGAPVTVKGLSEPVCYYRIPNPASNGQKTEGRWQEAVATGETA